MSKKKNRKPKTKPSNPVREVREVVIRIGDLLQCANAFNALKAMGIRRGKGADRMIKFMGIMASELKDIEAARKALVVAHGKERPDGTHGIAEDDTKAMDAYRKAFNELLDDETEIRLRPPSFDCLGGDTIPGILSELQIFFEYNEEDEIPDKAAPSKAEKPDE